MIHKLKAKLSKGIKKAMPDKMYLNMMYRKKIGKKLNLKHPITFNEKLQWLKLYNRMPEYTTMVDKYEVKKYVAGIIGEEYIIPTLGIWDRVEDIDFDSLPNQFVLKCTHDSGGLVICKDKSMFDIPKAIDKLKQSLSRNFFWYGREWPYKNVKPRIIAEKYMSDGKSDELTDYKFMCFDGKVKCIFTCTNRNTAEGLKVSFFDIKWNRLPFCRHYPADDKKIDPPLHLSKMIELAEKLAQNIPFVRVDFYEIEAQIYFGELTFFPGSGFEAFTPEEWDYKIGSWLTLPQKSQ